MPTYIFEAMDATGQNIRDEIEAPNEVQAQTMIRELGYFVTRLSIKKLWKPEVGICAEQRLQELGLELPPPPKPMGLYQPVLIVDDWAYLSGHGPLLASGELITGRIGADLDQAAGTAAARQTGLVMLASLRAKLGSLDRVAQTVKLLGLVACTPDFFQQPAVINGCSELFADVFGAERGVGARSAVGVNALPSNMAVEIEAVFRLV